MNVKWLFIFVLTISMVYPFISEGAVRKRAVRTNYTIRSSPVIDAGGLEEANKPTILYNVPFVRQTSLVDACEEASILMAQAWVFGLSVNSKFAAEQIRGMAGWEMANFGFHHDTSAADTAELMRGYYGYPAEVVYNITTADIRQALENRNIVLVAINGEKFYNLGGVPRHIIVIVGFDYAKDQFILHDPMQTSGNLRVDEPILAQSLRDYPSGIHKPVLTNQTAMIKISWPWIAAP